jgi:osmotically-inducible protein OsmY
MKHFRFTTPFFINAVNTPWLVMGYFILACFAVSACVPTLIAGAAAAGGIVVYDQRDLKTIREDNRIRYEINYQFRNDPLFKNSHLVVSSFNHVVLLVGQAPLAAIRVKAEELAKTQPNITRVYNEITIENPTSDLTRASDTWITTKIKSAMLVEKGLQSGAIKVVTENGVVFLMGRVSKKQANRAVNIARRVNGVQKVVRVFDIVAF